MKLQIVSRPRPPYETSCDVCDADGVRCMRFEVRESPSSVVDGAVIDICRSCVREAKRIALEPRPKRRGLS